MERSIDSWHFLRDVSFVLLWSASSLTTTTIIGTMMFFSWSGVAWLFFLLVFGGLIGSFCGFMVVLCGFMMFRFRVRPPGGLEFQARGLVFSVFGSQNTGEALSLKQHVWKKSTPTPVGWRSLSFEPIQIQISIVLSVVVYVNELALADTARQASFASACVRFLCCYLTL